MIRVVFVCLAVALVAVVEGAILHLETIPASLLISVFVIPSILGFALLKRYLPAWRRTRHIAFMLGLLPFGGMLLYGLIDPTGDLEVRDLCKLMVGFGYFTQALTACLLLVLPYRKAPSAADTVSTLPAPPGNPVSGPASELPGR